MIFYEPLAKIYALSLLIQLVTRSSTEGHSTGKVSRGPISTSSKISRQPQTAVPQSVDIHYGSEEEEKVRSQIPVDLAHVLLRVFLWINSLRNTTSLSRIVLRAHLASRSTPILSPIMDNRSFRWIGSLAKSSLVRSVSILECNIAYSVTIPTLKHTRLIHTSCSILEPSLIFTQPYRQAPIAGFSSLTERLEQGEVRLQCLNGNVKRLVPPVIFKLI